MRRLFVFSAVALVAALAACSDNGPAGSCNPGPTLAAPQLLYPIPGATGVPYINLNSPNGYLVVQNVGPAGGTLYVNSGGVPIAAQSLGAVPSPAPSPALSPSPGATPLAAQIPNLSPGTAYTVSFSANPPTTCVQAQSSSVNIGSFVTQASAALRGLRP
jgi:hypothetical protein